ncbi:50S ribosome-binding GTPase, partial [bacterium]|nr:50S ribosome-binding GTPase [bacterium]
MATPPLRALADDLDHLDLSLSPVGEASRIEAVRLIRDVVLPRLSDDTAPLVVAVVGPTGSGKSTLINAMAGAIVSNAGALRPTTRTPVLWSSHVPPPALDAVRRRYGLADA